MSVATSTVYQSRYGYHPCDRETSLKLKRFRFLLYLAYRDYKSSLRYLGRSPRNRDLKSPRLPLCVLFSTRLTTYSAKRQRMVTSPVPVLSFMLVTRNDVTTNLFFHVDEQYHSARHPVATPDEVKPLRLPSDWQSILQQLESHYAK